MATTTAAELRHLDNDSLEEKLREHKEELFNLRFQAATGQLESHGRLRHVQAATSPGSTRSCASASSGITALRRRDRRRGRRRSDTTQQRRR